MSPAPLVVLPYRTADQPDPDAGVLMVDRDVDLEIRAVHRSRHAVHVRYAVGHRAYDTD
ncbi:hypothetical protein [Micromonospora sp. CNB394]|uniref:hypothetical protein n=1 Tax=Micromonospora sp. CNB394 TaxID=1169151 RepID=UPI00036A4DFB|nr:hypothetical protein [Micromonospora sp. CNB394]